METSRRRLEDATLLALKVKEEATSQGMQKFLEAEKRKEVDSLQEPPKELSSTDFFLEGF